MDDITESHLLTARINAEFAKKIAVNSFSIGEVNWAAVAAFYAAVHCVNGHLWETARLQPRNHTDRQRIIARWPALSALLPQYLRLADYGYRARYFPGFQMAHADMVQLIQRDLHEVQQTISYQLES